MIRLASAGDTLLGSEVGEVIRRRSPVGLVAAEAIAAAREADLVLINLECSISERGAPWPRRKFRFRALPAAVERWRSSASPASASPTSLLAVARRINGGLNGLDDRRA